MLWRVLLLAALGGALVEEHDPRQSLARGGHPEDDDDTVVIDGKYRPQFEGELSLLH
jgi:hypothetical protein